GSIVAAGTPDTLKAELGSDVLTVGLDRAQHEHARAALVGLARLDHVTDAAEGLALYVGDGAAAVADVVQLLTAAGVRPGTITLSRPSLDDVFLAATGR